MQVKNLSLALSFERTEERHVPSFILGWILRVVVERRLR